MKTHAMKTLAITALIGLAFSAQAYAAPQALTPQTLDLTTGQAGGDAFAASATSLILTTAFDENDDVGTDFNVSGFAPLAAGGALESFAGHPAGEYDIGRFDGSSGTAMEGSVFVMENLSFVAGDTVSFDWAFYTNEPATGAYADAAYFSVLNSMTALLANAASGITGDPGLSGYRAATSGLFAHTFAQTGTYNLVFGVVDTGDSVASSALAINNLTVTPVPEPGEWMLMLAGLGLVGLMVQRNGRRLG